MVAITGLFLLLVVLAIGVGVGFAIGFYAGRRSAARQFQSGFPVVTTPPPGDTSRPA